MKSISAFFGRYLGHLTSYVVGASAIVAGLDPKLLPPQVAFVVAIAGIVTTAAHHGYKAGALQGATQAALDALAKAKAPIALIPALLAIVFLVGLPGCAISPGAQPVVESVVFVAVGVAETNGVSAQEINTIAKAALLANSSTGATLATVAQAVNVEIAKLNLPAVDLAAANILEAAIAAEIQNRIGQNASVATAQASVAEVLGYAVLATGG